MRPVLLSFALLAASAAMPGSDGFSACKLIVQLDHESITAESRPRLLADIRRSGADGLEIAWGEFHLDGERLTRALPAYGFDFGVFR